ncbi:MAG: RluA family pseudouridine synthase [Muribaculaceae bacterium]|nr:RluA family pseudouridine synthase [Muribaculaceae bacterium]MDE6346967.1 RluA family pseudouridine synthase [Muribaculaceae bacterium]
MKPLKAKPGAERRRFTPDVIESYTPAEETRLLEFLFASMPQRKRTTVKELLRHNQVKVNDEVVTQFDIPLTAADTVHVNLTREFPRFYNRRLKIVHEDGDIIVVNKGYGLLSMGNDKVKEGTAYSILKEYVKWVDPRQKIFIVHRLDRDTSGLMMFAKNVESKESMQHNWNNMVLNRTYVAVVEGNVENDEGVIRTYLAENSKYEVYVTENPEEGQLAVTRYKVLRRKNGYTLMELELDTGRKNQIRVHMKHIGHPIAGDRRYGAKSSPIHRLALHARTLRFVHPISRREMNFSTPVPASFQKMVN